MCLLVCGWHAHNYHMYLRNTIQNVNGALMVHFKYIEPSWWPKWIVFINLIHLNFMVTFLHLALAKHQHELNNGNLDHLNFKCWMSKMLTTTADCVMCATSAEQQNWKHASWWLVAETVPSTLNIRQIRFHWKHGRIPEM